MRISDRRNLREGKVAPAAPPMAVNDETRQQLLNRLQQRIMAELGFVEPIDPDRPLNEVGLDLLRSVTLANNLEDEFGILVSISELISGPTINQLVDHLLDLFAGIAKDEPGEPRPAMTSTAAITALAATPPIAPAHVNSGVAPAAHGLPRSVAPEARVAKDQIRDGAGLQQITNGHAPDETAINPARKWNPRAYPDVGMNEKTPPASKWGNGAGTEDFAYAGLSSRR